jgi:cell division protein FtsQ
VATQGNNRTRTFAWDDEAPAEPRFRRVQQTAPVSGRGLPGMPLEMEDPDGDLPSASRKTRFGSPKNPWWRPTGTWGRAFLGIAALIAVCAFAIAVHVSKSFLERDARFRIAGTSAIQATGLAEVSRADMLPVFGEDIGRNIFFVPLAERRHQLEQIPWVQSATVMRLLPDQIRISVIERKPVAFVRHGQQIGLVDANGVLLSMPVAMMAQHHYSFPVLTGIDGGDPLPARKARIDLYLRLLGDLDANGQRLSDQISEIDLTDPEDARVLMPEQGADVLAHFGEDHFFDRYQRYKAHIGEWRQQYPKLAAVDLRYDQQVVLEMTAGSSTEQTAVTADSSKPAPDKPAADKPAPALSDSAKSNSPIKPAADKPAPAVTAKADSPQHATIAKPPATREIAKSDPPKTTAPHKTAAAPKTVAAVKTSRPHTTATAKAAAKTKEQRVNELAAKMREKKRAEMRRAALNKSKPKSAPKPHASASAGQGQ